MLRIDDIPQQVADDIHASRRDLGAKRLKYLQIYGIMEQRKAVNLMARYHAITSKDRKSTMDKKRRRICIIVDIIYILLLMFGIMIIGKSM